MIKELNITIDGAELNCSVNFEYFKEDGEVTININSIKHGSMEVLYHISDDLMEDVKWKCQKYYEDTAFEYWEQRYEERNSGLARD